MADFWATLAFAAMCIPSRNASGNKVFTDGGVLDAEAAVNLGQRGSLLVEVGRFIDLAGVEDVLAPLNPMAVQDRSYRSAVKAELLSKVPHIAARLVLGDEIGLLGIGDVPLRVEDFRCLERLVIWEELPRVTSQEP